MTIKSQPSVGFFVSLSQKKPLLIKDILLVLGSCYRMQKTYSTTYF
jgi:hypothetical protein